MRKIFSILMAVLFVGVLFATPSTSTLTFTAACGGTGTADDDAVWTVTSDGTESNYDATKGIHYGTSSAAVGYIQLSTSDIAGTITSVVVNASAASGVSASVSVTVGEDAFTCESETTAAVSASATDYTFEGSASGEIVVRLAKAASAKKALYVKSVVVTYEEAEASTTKTYYLTLSSDWAGWPAKYAIYYFKSSDNTQNGWSEFMTAVPEEDNTYIGTIPAGYDKLIFARFNSEATAPAWDSNKWSQTVDLTAPTNDNDWFTVTSGGTGSECNGTWSKHGEPVIPAKFYITGDSALVTDAGAPGKAWNPDAIKSETDTFTLKNLKAGQEYILKLTLNGTWVGENNVKGYNELTEKTPGLKDVSDDHNIGFKLNEAGNVQVIYKDGETPVFKLVGNFVVEIPAKFYITGDSALVTDAGAPGKAWVPNAIKSETDTFTLKNLKADQYYIIKLTLNGTWEGENNVKGYNELTEKTAGLDDVSDDHNIGFKLNAAGDVKVVYTETVFKLIGDFYVAPVVEPAKYYITGDSALVTDAGAPGKAWNPDAIKSETDTFTLKNLKADQYYILKLTLNGTWVGENNVKGYNELTEKTAGLDDVSDDHNIGFKLNEAGDVKVVYIADETPVFKLIGDFYVSTPHYFIAGTMTNWKDEMVELLPLEEKTDSLGVALNLKADSLYAYKIVRVLGPDTAWYGLDGEATMEYGNSTGWYIYKSEGEKNQKNVGLQTTKEGDYPVTLVIKEDQLIVSVVIPKPDTKYYAKYADKAGEWNWKLLTEKEGKWLTDTIVYYGGGMNIHSAAEGDGKYFAEIAGVAAKDTAYFSFNPEDSTLVATVVGKYIKPFPVMQIAGQWDMEGENWIVNNMVLAADSLTATYEVSLEKGDYEFKLIKDGKWITKANGGEPYGLHRTWPGVAGVVDEATENLKLTADVAGKYLFTWTFANDSIGITFPDKPEPKLADGYYLVGKFSGVDAWSVEDLSAAKLFAVNPENDKEYQLNITLAVEDSLKVVYVADDVITTWFPAEGDNYGVDANHAGATTIYFRPDYQGGEDWFAGCLYVVPTSTVDIEITNDGVQAIKVLRNGQILIIKGEKTYNAQGQLVR